MCYNPIRIINPRISSKTTHFNSFTDSEYLIVPCGHCGECLSKQKTEYETRAYYEYLRTKMLNGFTFFETFTYAPVFVPKFHGLLVFSQSDYQKFMKRLRSALVRAGYQLHNEDGENLLKVFWVCEYGGTYFRPHYHALFFVAIPGLTPTKFYEFLCKAWNLGILDISRTPDQKVVSGQGAISYVCKYIAKDSDFLDCVNKQKSSTFKQWFISEYNQLFKVNMSNDTYIRYDMLVRFFSVKNAEIREENKNRKRNNRIEEFGILPYHRQSRGFGSYILQMYSLADLLNGAISIPDKIKIEKSVSLPNYIIRKIFYNYDKQNKVYVLNDLGLQFKINKFEHGVIGQVDSYKKILSSWQIGLDQRLVQNILTEINAKFHLDLKIPSDVSNYVDSLNISFDSLASYALFYRYRDSTKNYTGDVITDLKDSLMNTKYVNDDFIVVDDYGTVIPHYQLDYIPGKDNKSYIYIDNKIRIPYVQNCVRFEIVLSILELLHTHICQFKQNLYNTKEKAKSEFRGTYYALRDSS